jgi:radical SAM superfamily enzyme YgiQ (UPF0313 family)
VEQVKLLRSLHVETQACFVLGYPGESEADRLLTEEYSLKLLKSGLGEVAYFIVSPMPGTAIEGKIEGDYHLTDLNFSSAWRKDYQLLIDWRNRLYRQFFLFRIFKTPLFLLQNILRVLTGSYRLKMEMFPRRKFRTFLSERRAAPLFSSIAQPKSDLSPITE